MSIAKLALGTVQFGLDYGVSNNSGQVSQTEIANILEFARANNITTLDTAHAYGNAEQNLGKVIGGNSYQENQWQVISKIPPITDNERPLVNYLTESLARLQIDQLYGLMLHRAEQLTDSRFEQLQVLKLQRLVKKIGVSVYSPEQVLTVIKQFDIDIIQLPLNLLDQRFVTAGVLQSLVDKNIEIHARSLFLQGLLLMPTATRPTYFQQFTGAFQAIEQVCQEQQCTALTLALSLIHQLPQVDKFVIGVQSAKELAQILHSYQQAADINCDLAQFSASDLTLIDPSLWPKFHDS